MSLPTSIRAYLDCKELFDKAADDPRGIRACLGTHGAAVHFRGRMNYFRALDREANAKVYPVDDPMHGESTYDEYVVQLLEDTNAEWWVYVQRRQSKILAIESLSDPDKPVVLEGTIVEAPKMIEHQGEVE